MAHFLETLDVNELKSEYIHNLQKVEIDSSQFDLSYLIENFNKNVRGIRGKTEYYPILTEIAKLNRAELTEFKKGFVRTIEKCKEEDFVLPYRIYIPRTDCAFVFAQLMKRASKN